MTLLTRPEKLALLINLLGDDAAEMARAGLDKGSKTEFEDALSDFRDYPPSQEEIDLVLEDFQSYFEMAVDAAENDAEDADSDADSAGLSILQIPEEQFEIEIEPTKKFEPPNLTGNLNVDLNRLHPYQVAQALRNETPDIVAMVVRKLADEHAAKTLEFLPDSTRSTIFMQLGRPSHAKPLIEELVLGKTIELAMLVEQREDNQEASEKMSKLMRSLPRAIRVPMLEELTQENPELAEAIKNKLYLFEDLLLLEARDMQKLLTQCRTEVLVVALQNVEEDMLEHVLGNMSKRAKESLQEEMEFKQNAKQEEIDEGRKEVVQVLSELVESGAVSLD